MEYDLLDFAQLFNALPQDSSKSLLLGNGFSISYLSTLGIQRPPFSYQQIVNDLIDGYRNGDYQFIGNIEEAFNIADTINIEEVIRELLNFAKYTDVYGVNGQNVIQDIELLKDLLPTIISENHPSSPNRMYHDGNEILVPDAMYRSCGNFLGYFHDVFTLNYDLFLYWAINCAGLTRTFYDGFGKDGGQGDLIWRDTYKEPQYKKFYYLHGGLHYYKYHLLDDFLLSLQLGNNCEKIEFDTHTTDRIMDQIREKVQQGKLPVVVVEGTSGKKKEFIKGNDVLVNAFLKLSNLVGDIFVFGFDLGNEDDHLVEAILNSNVNNVCFGVFGADDFQNRAHRIYTRFFARASGRRMPNFHFYDTSTMNIWTDY